MITPDECDQERATWIASETILGPEPVSFHEGNGDTGYRTVPDLPDNANGHDPNVYVG